MISSFQSSLSSGLRCPRTRRARAAGAFLSSLHRLRFLSLVESTDALFFEWPCMETVAAASLNPLTLGRGQWEYSGHTVSRRSLSKTADGSARLVAATQRGIGQSNTGESSVVLRILQYEYIAVALFMFESYPSCA